MAALLRAEDRPADCNVGLCAGPDWHAEVPTTLASIQVSIRVLCKSGYYPG